MRPNSMTFRGLTTAVLLVVGLALGPASATAQSPTGVLSAIPSEAIGFAVVHNLSGASRSIDELAKLVAAPAPNLLGLAKQATGLQKGLDDGGDLAIVLTSIEPAPKPVALVPVANFADFFAALHAEGSAPDIVEVQLAGAPALVGRKGSYAAIARTEDRDALEKLLASPTNLAADASLATWLDANQASFVVTAQGVKQLLPKLTNGVRAAQAQLRQIGEANGQPAANALELYVNLFAAAEAEVEQFGLGLRIDAARTVDLVKRVQFAPGGAWAKWAADAKPAAEDLFAVFPAEPFVMALGAVVPQGATDSWMKLSLQLMRNQPQFELTAEQAQKYSELSAQAMQGVRSMRMLLGVAAPEAGFYGNTSAVMTVDDAPRYLERYEQSLAAMRELALETKSPLIPTATSQRIKIGETEALEVSMTLPQLKQLTNPGGPDMQRMMELMFGAQGELKIYVAAADAHTVVMAYTSPERLKAALAFSQSKQPGLSSDAGVAKVAAALPPGSQVVAYVSLGGVAKAAKQFATMFPGGHSVIPDFADSPPFGIAAKVSPAGAEGHLVVTAETLRVIGAAVAKARGAAPAPGRAQPQ